MDGGFPFAVRVGETAVRAGLAVVDSARRK
jgi:hypothetical protein